MFVDTSCTHHNVLTNPGLFRTGPACVAEPRAYCEAETFRPECAADAVIRIGVAMYGRQQTSKCVYTNYGFVGCVDDVRDRLDGLCSGRRRCEVRLPDADLDLRSSCPADLKTYLNVSYKCVKGERRLAINGAPDDQRRN